MKNGPCGAFFVYFLRHVQGESMQFGPFCLIKVLVVSISFALAICFVGCGDDSSTGISNDTKIEADADDVSSSSKADEDEKISSSSMDDEEDEISSNTEGDEEDDEEDEEEAESSSSSKKSEKSSSSSKKKAKSSSSSAVVNKESSSSAGEEDPGVEPAEPESSPSSEGEYPDLSVLNDPNLKQGCDIDKNDNVWVIPSFGMAAAKTVYIWKGDEVSVYNLLEFPLGDAKTCESLKDSYTGLFAPENDAGEAAESYCDSGTLRIIADANEPVKGDRDSLFESATLLCLEEEE